MKKYLAIFLLVLLPLQFSWAAVAGYCQHEAGVTAKHLGHHGHEHASVDHQDASKQLTKSGELDHDCATCHMGCAAALIGDIQSVTLSVAHPSPLDYHVNLSLVPTKRPDRPRWPGLA